MIDHPRAEWWRQDARLDDASRSAPVDSAKPQVSGSAVPYWALMTFTFILFIAPQTYFPALGPLRIALIASGFAIAAYLVDAFVHRRPMPFPSQVRIAACLVAWALVTLPLSYWPWGGLTFLLDVYLKSVATFWLLSGVVNTVSRLRRLAWALTLMTVPLAATTLDNFISGAVTDGRVVGYQAPLTANPNGLALVLTLILPLGLGLFFVTRSTLARLVLLAVVALDVAAVVVTFSRAGFLTLAMVMAMYLYRFLRRPERPWAIVICVLLAACVPLFPSGYVERLATITDIEADPTGSAQERKSDTLTAIRLVLERPIVGAGIGQNVLALNDQRGATWRSVHNVYLVYAVDLGVPGLLLFVLLLVRCINDAGYARRRSAGVPALRDLFYLAEALQTTLVVFAIAAPFHTNAYELHFYYFGGLAVAAKSLYGMEMTNAARREEGGGGLAPAPV